MFRVKGVVPTSIMENQMARKMAHEMETGVI